MGLADVERALARLYTDAALRVRFATDPQQAAAELALSPDDLAYLTEVPAGDIESYARSLVSKRAGEVRKLLPLSCRALGETALRQAFEEHARTYVPTGVHKHVEDALAFARSWLAGHPEADWQRDVVRYEAARLHLLSRSWRVKIACFAHDVRSYAADRDLAVPPRRKIWVAWLRTPQRLREWPLSRG
jgi:hypothetical protein